MRKAWVRLGVVDTCAAPRRGAAQEFEERYESTSVPRGEKTETVQRAVLKLKRFHIRELQKSCPEVSLDMIRKVPGRNARQR
jgi:hypothetical protein